MEILIWIIVWLVTGTLAAMVISRAMYDELEETDLGLSIFLFIFGPFGLAGALFTLAMLSNHQPGKRLKRFLLGRKRSNE